MYTKTFGRKAWILVSLLQLGFNFSGVSKPVTQLSAMHDTQALKDGDGLIACGATFIPGPAFKDCLHVSVHINDCNAVPTVDAEGCIPAESGVQLGTINVVDENGTLVSLWALRSAEGGIVEVVILDIE